MAYLVSASDEDVIHATTHGIMTRDDLGFLRERMDSAMRSAGSFASEYLTKASEKLASFNLGRLRDRVEAMRDRFGHRWDDDRVRHLPTLSDLQQAKPTMRKYAMADIRTRRLFQQGRLEGYGELYVDEEPGAIGRNHTAWREVYNGSYVQDEVGDEDRFITCLGVEDEHGEQPLVHSGRVSVRATHETMAEILDRGKQDPTSQLRKTL